MKLARMAAIAAGLLVLTLAAVACGGDGDDNGDEGDATQPAATSTRAVATAPPPEPTEAPEATEEVKATETSAPAPTATATTAPTVDALTVNAGDFAFNPNALSVDGANDTAITLNNTGGAPHSMKIYRDAGYGDAVAGADTDLVSAGASGSLTLTSTNIGAATQLFFRCEVHPSQMEGTIAVE